KNRIRPPFYNLLTTFHSQGFSNYQDSLWYEVGTVDHGIIASLKTGELKSRYGEFLEVLEVNADIITTLKKDYRDNVIDYEIKEYVDEVVQKYVKNKLKAELRWVTL
ncbi:hypothetical protein, partial [Streptococcus lutetiensis]|uniref:hypothetical protein n=1 Tax=Streptococcus lutetiensis TaxID=150055 RepID=UPI0015F2C893